MKARSSATHVAFAPNGRHLAAVGEMSLIVSWDAATGTEQDSFERDSCAASTDGSHSCPTAIGWRLSGRVGRSPSWTSARQNREVTVASNSRDEHQKRRFFACVPLLYVSFHKHS